MDGREAIINKILSDAEEKAAAYRADAEQKNAASLENAGRQAALYLGRGRKALAAEAEELVARRKTVAALDGRKRLLAAKRGVLEEAFTLAVKSACAFPKKKYLAVLCALLDRFAEEGDSVELCAEAPVTEKELTACKAFTEKKLVFAGKTGRFEGGMRLENAVCVKDLSFRALLEAARSGLERGIADALFPAEK